MNLPLDGLDAAKTAHLDCSVVVIPAFATLIVCWLRASCMLSLSSFFILSSSSMQASPPSASGNAPASIVHSPLFRPELLLDADAVNPAPEAAFPDA